jgi:2-amino-4-hydroxy-6-hydroxymethyldihydropteridine diphosphokinase
MPQVFLGLGSNLGDRADTIRKAFTALSSILAHPRMSSLWESKARYVEDQENFINTVVSGDTELSPRRLLHEVQEIETHFGRDRGNERPKGPRSLDIDILLFGEALIAETDLIVPHPGMRERKFVLLPLLELDPGLVDPASSERFDRHLAVLPNQGIYLFESGIYDIQYA